MDAAIFQNSRSSLLPRGIAGAAGRVINGAEFRELLVSHRRMVRADRRGEKLRGLQDLDTGEVFLTDERRLLEPQREFANA
jgi:hypothetical protein